MSGSLAAPSGPDRGFPSEALAVRLALFKGRPGHEGPQRLA